MGIGEFAAVCSAAIPPIKADGTPASSFRMSGLIGAAFALSDLDHLLPGLIDLQHQLGGTVGGHVVGSIFRASFLIEPVVLPAATTTRFKTRWGLDGDDPRFASPGECLAIANVIIRELSMLAKTEQGRLILHGLAERRLVAYELPIGYIERRLPIHRADNIALFDEDVLRHVAGFRLLLLDPKNPLQLAFREAYRRKIAVKTYLTDRALTGDHKTNREKRWEAHPDSVQFSLRNTCLEIELTLVNQMCHFNGFPDDLLRLLSDAELLIPAETPARCPVTLLPFDFEVFAAEVLAPEQGRSAFQVGHLDPLKLDGNVWTNGHRADNIGWISATGNRIQGSLSVRETRSMLVEIWHAYREAGLFPEDK